MTDQDKAAVEAMRASYVRAINSSGYSQIAQWAMDHGRLLLEVLERAQPAPEASAGGVTGIEAKSPAETGHKPGAPDRLMEFAGRDGLCLAFQRSSIRALVELDAGLCQVVTGDDLHVVAMGYDEARDYIWPEVDSPLGAARAMAAQ